MVDQATRSARWRVLVIVVVIFSALAAFLWLRTRQIRSGNNSHVPHQTPPQSAFVTPVVSPLPLSTAPLPPSPTATASSMPAQSPINYPAPLADSFVGRLSLVIPVVGVKPNQLLDTFSDARSEGRVHDAIDIPAPAGTAVLAAADGEIIKLFQSDRGGTTIYQLSADRKLVFYYAHLQSYAAGLVEGRFVKQGEVIAYVGDTGNAGPGNFHLHFSISIVADPKRYWEGTNINPYPLLHQ